MGGCLWDTDRDSLRKSGDVGTCCSACSVDVAMLPNWKYVCVERRRAWSVFDAPLSTYNSFRIFASLLTSERLVTETRGTAFVQLRRRQFGDDAHSCVFFSGQQDQE